jgi:hypothetical protein
MVVDRIYNRIYIVYSTHVFPIYGAYYKEVYRFIVYTWKNFTDTQDSWTTNTQLDICSSTNSGSAIGLYKNYILNSGIIIGSSD